MKTVYLLLCCLLTASAAHAWERPAAAPVDKFPLDIAIYDPDADATATAKKVHPYVVMFEKGVDIADKDVRGPLGRLEALRGASKMFPESNDDQGLPVVLRGLRFHRKVDEDKKAEQFEVELQGEFNTVKVAVSKDQMQTFLAGEPVTFTLKGQKNYGLFSYVSTMKMDVQHFGKEIVIYKIEGDFSFREGFYTYTSKTKKLLPAKDRKYLYRGEFAELPDLPSI